MLKKSSRGEEHQELRPELECVLWGEGWRKPEKGVPITQPCRYGEAGLFSELRSHWKNLNMRITRSNLHLTKSLWRLG